MIVRNHPVPRNNQGPCPCQYSLKYKNVSVTCTQNQQIYRKPFGLNTFNIMTSTRKLTRIPNLFALIPFTWQGPNPLHCNSPEIRSTLEWARSQGDLDGSIQQKIDKAVCELFGAFAYPYANIDMLLFTNDSTAMIIILDEYAETADLQSAEKLRHTVMNAMTGKTPEDDSLVANITRELVSCLYQSILLVINKYTIFDEPLA